MDWMATFFAIGVVENERNDFRKGIGLSHRIRREQPEALGYGYFQESLLMLLRHDRENGPLVHFFTKHLVVAAMRRGPTEH